MGRFLEKVGWGGQLGGIQNQPGAFEEKCLVTLILYFPFFREIFQRSVIYSYFVNRYSFIREIFTVTFYS